MSGPSRPSSSGRIKREREQSSDLYSIDDGALVPAKRQREQYTDVKVPEDLRSIYEQLLPKPESGIKFLFDPTFASTLKSTASRLAAEYRIKEDEAIEEVRRLFAMKAFTSDEKASKISPTPLMDELWHAAILDTQFYASLQEALGVIIHHRPEGASDKEAKQRAKRLSVMKGIYKTFFSTDSLELRPATPPASPLQLAPINMAGYSGHNSISITVNTFRGNIVFKVKPQVRLGKVMNVVGEKIQMDRKQFRMIYEGSRVDDEDTIESLDAYDGDFFEVLEEQCGC